MPSESRGRRLSFSRLPHIIGGYIYIYWWIGRSNISSRFGRHVGRGTSFLLAIYLLLLLGEVVLEIVGYAVPRQSPLIQLLFFVLIAIAMKIKIAEWSDDGQELYFARAAAEIVRVLNRVTPESPGGDLEIHDLLVLFWRAFEKKGVINVNVALFDQETNGLRVRHVYPKEAVYDEKLVLPPGKGGAGICYQDRCVVYIPSRHFGHAIVEDFSDPGIYSLVPDCYERCEVEPFRSILSVPLVAFGRAYGVLNFDSSKRNMFNKKDFAQVSFFGFAMAQCLQASQMA